MSKERAYQDFTSKEMFEIGIRNGNYTKGTLSLIRTFIWECVPTGWYKSILMDSLNEIIEKGGK